MIKGNKKKPQVFFDSDDEHDLDLFCRIEEALQNDTQQDNNYLQQQQEQSRLASEFPTCFVHNAKARRINDQREHFNSENDNDNIYEDMENENSQSVEISKEEIIQFHEMYKEFQAKLCFLSEKQKEIDRDSNWIKKEKKELERERKRIEADRLIVEADLSNIELIDLRKQYDELQQKYETEKSEWEKEKNMFLQQIEQLKGNNPIINTNSKKNKRKSKLDESLHVDFKLPDDPSVNQNIEIENSNIKEEIISLQNNNSFQLNSSSSSSPPSTKKQEVNSIKKNKQIKPKLSIFTNTPLHPNYHLELNFEPGPVIKEEVKSNDGRKLLRYKNNLSATLFPNGTRKMRYKDNIFIFYSNGDVAQEFKDGARGYRYAETGAIELQLPDNTIYYEFPEILPIKASPRQKASILSNPNIKQREIHHPDGNKEILYPNGAKKILHLNGDYEIYHPAGRVERCVNGHVINTYD